MTSDVLHGTYDVFIPSDPSPGLILLRCDMVLVRVVGDVRSLGHGSWSAQTRASRGHGADLFVNMRSSYRFYQKIQTDLIILPAPPYET